MLLIVLFSSCVGKKTPTIERENNGFLVERVKRKGDWHIIYASKQDTLYKIVSKRTKVVMGLCDKIKIGKKYEFVLQSQKDFAPTINGVKINPVNFSGCYYYSEKTLICLEPENGIWDLYTAKNIKGLYYCN